MNTRRRTEGVYVGTGVEFVIEDDYSNTLDAHRVLTNARVGTTTMFEKEIVAVEESSKIAHVRTAWADMDTGGSGDEDLNHGPARVNERRLVKGSLSSLGVSARRLAKGSLSSLRGCWAAASIPRAGTEAAVSFHAGGGVGRRMNGLSRQATGVSRSETSGRPRRAASCLKAQEYLFWLCRNIPNHPFARGQCTRSRPSLRAVGEGECQSWHGYSGGQDQSRIALTLWAGRQTHLGSFTCRQKTQNQMPRWHLAQGETNSGIPFRCKITSARSGARAGQIRIHCCMVAERTV
jgi:hypothetical protein